MRPSDTALVFSAGWNLARQGGFHPLPPRDTLAKARNSPYANSSPSGELLTNPGSKKAAASIATPGKSAAISHEDSTAIAPLASSCPLLIMVGGCQRLTAAASTDARLFLPLGAAEGSSAQLPKRFTPVAEAQNEGERGSLPHRR